MSVFVVLAFFCVLPQVLCSLPPPVGHKVLVEGYQKKYDFPLLNGLPYLGTLSTKASDNHPRSATIIVGPRGSGKSEGLQLMKEAWKASGHLVFDLNLKGRSNNLSSDGALQPFGRRISNFIGSFEDVTFSSSPFECMKSYIKENCPRVGQLGEPDQNVGAPEIEESNIIAFISGEIQKNWKMLPLVASFSSAFLVGFVFVISKLKEIWKWFRSLSILYIIFGFICFILILVVTIYVINLFKFAIPFWLHCLQGRVQDGDWGAIVCANNAISTCVPEQRPILILREISKLSPEALNQLLTALEPFQEGGVLFPVFLETSNFGWLDSPALFTSQHSFDVHYMPEISFEEAREQLVDKIWTQSEFEIIYGVVGGHVGSLHTVFRQNKKEKRELKVVLEGLKKRSEQELHVIVDKIEEGEMSAVEQMLTKARNLGYVFDAKTTPSCMKPFLSSNMFFQYGDEMYPQNELAKQSLDRYLDGKNKECDEVIVEPLAPESAKE